MNQDGCGSCFIKNLEQMEQELCLLLGHHQSNSCAPLCLCPEDDCKPKKPHKKPDFPHHRGHK